MVSKMSAADLIKETVSKWLNKKDRNKFAMFCLSFYMYFASDEVILSSNDSQAFKRFKRPLLYPYRGQLGPLVCKAGENTAPMYPF